MFPLGTVPLLPDACEPVSVNTGVTAVSPVDGVVVTGAEVDGAKVVVVVVVDTESGVTALLADEYEPVPTLVTAATLKRYDVPFDNPVTVALVAVRVPSVKVVHVPLSAES
jgi:hypothetical protein